MPAMPDKPTDAQLDTELTSPTAGEPQGPRMSRLKPLRRMYDWVLSWADTPYGTPALFVLSFAESSFFPIPPDVLQIALSVARPKRAFYYAGVSVIASVLGAIVGWFIGYALWAAVGDFFFAYVPGVDAHSFARVQGLYQQYGFLAILVAAFTPIPYKVFTIAAGVFEIALPVLLLASVLGRSARFFAVAAFLYVFGPGVKNLIERYFDVAALAFTALLIAGFVVIKYVL